MSIYGWDEQDEQTAWWDKCSDLIVSAWEAGSQRLTLRQYRNEAWDEYKQRLDGLASESKESEDE